MSTAEFIFDKANGRLQFKIGGSIVVSACNDGWENGDINGTSTDGTLTIDFNNSSSFWTFQFVHTGGTDEIYIDGKA